MLTANIDIRNHWPILRLRF